MSSTPTITSFDVDSAIVEKYFEVLKDGLTTVCVLTLDNGHKVSGLYTCVCTENMAEGVGDSMAYVEAKGKVWPLLAFRRADQRAGS